LVFGLRILDWLLLAANPGFQVIHIQIPKSKIQMNYYNYFTEIEEHFVRRRGKHLFVSPMDWSLMAAWRDSGVPLHVALRGIDRAMDGFFAKQSRSPSKVSSLFYCHASVMEEYTRHLESHLGEAPAEGSGGTAVDAQAEVLQPAGPDKKAVQEFLNARIVEIKALPAKLCGVECRTEGIDRILERLDEIARDLDADNQVDFESLDRDLAILDQTLVGELRAVIPPEQIAAWDQEARKDLKIYRKKLPKNTYGKILDNFMCTKIHRHFAVGELSLFHM
jgi:hypothetical protein